MAFIIDNLRIPFSDYRKLDQHQENHPFVIDIISLIDLWNDQTVSEIEVQTSGSTGVPKLITLSKSSLRQSALKTLKHFQLKKGDKALLSLPAKYIAGKMMILRAIIGELDIILKEPCTFPMGGIDFKVDFLPLTPFQFIKSYNQDKKSFESVRTVLLGGGPVGNMEIKMAKEIHSKVVHGFGMTETITHIATRNITEDIYTALEGVTFSTYEDRLIISADHLAEQIETNDEIELLTPKTFIWVGRSDNVINSGGIKIFPEQVELKIAKLITAHYFISGEKDKNLGEKLVLYIESLQASNFYNLKHRLKEILSKYEVPKEVYLLPKFLLTETGKIRRQGTIDKYGKNKISL